MFSCSNLKQFFFGIKLSWKIRTGKICLNKALVNIIERITFIILIKRTHGSQLRNGKCFMIARLIGVCSAY